MAVRPFYRERGFEIYRGEAQAVIRNFRGKFDAIVTDPPYGINYQHSGGGKGKHHRRQLVPVKGDQKPFDPRWLLKLSPNVLMWGANHYCRLLPANGRWLAWDKLNRIETFDSFSDVEFAWHSKKGASRLYSYLWKGILQDGEKDVRREHPTQKPLALMKWCFMQMGLKAGDVVLDPYMGSGTTLRAAKDMGLLAIGIELDKKYCQIAVERLRQSVMRFDGSE